MKIIVAATNIQIGEMIYPLNAISFKTNGEIVSINPIGTNEPIAQDNFGNFTNSSNLPYASAAAVIADLKLSLVAP